MDGKTLSLKGSLEAAEDITISGTIDGSILCPGHAVVVAASAQIVGDILADDITVFGKSGGQLTAATVVDIRAGASVSGRVISKRFILDGDATFNGHVEPQHLEAALRVAEYKKRGGPS